MKLRVGSVLMSLLAVLVCALPFKPRDVSALEFAFSIRAKKSSDLTMLTHSGL